MMLSINHHYGHYPSTVAYFSLTERAARAVEIFLQALLTRGANYALSRKAKTLTVGHL